MRAPWSDPPDDDGKGLDEANAALDEALARWDAVKETSEEMRRLRRANHFAERMVNALRGESS